MGIFVQKVRTSVPTLYLNKWGISVISHELPVLHAPYRGLGGVATVYFFLLIPIEKDTFVNCCKDEKLFRHIIWTNTRTVWISVQALFPNRWDLSVLSHEPTVLHGIWQHIAPYLNLGGEMLLFIICSHY